MAIGPIGPLPAMPNPAAGATGLSNPLSQIMQAITQFPQQEQDAEKLQEMRRTNAMQRLQLLAQQVQGNPQISQNPSWQNTAKNLYKAAGVPPPLDASGNIDVNALSPKVKLAEAFAKDPTLLTEAQQMDPVTRKAVFGAGAYDTAGIEPTFWQQPAHYFMSAGERTYLQRGLNDDLRAMATGNLTVPQFMSWIDTNKQNMALLGMNPDAIVQSNPDILGKLSETTKAKIQQMQDLGILRKDQALKALAEMGTINSLNDLRKAQSQYYTVRADAIPKQLQLKAMQLQQSFSLRSQELGIQEQRLQNAMQDTTLRGMGLRLQAANQLRVSLDADKRDYTALLGIAQRYVTAGSAVDPNVVQQLSDIKQRITQDDAMIAGAQKVQGTVGGIDTPKVTAAHGVTPGSKGTAKMSDIKKYAQQHGWSLGDAVKKYIEAGYKVEP